MKSALAAILLCVQIVVFAIPVNAIPLPAATPQPQPTSSLHYGDLSNLKFTATDHLTVKILSPVEGEASPIDATQVDVATTSGAGVELRINGEPVATSHLGERNVYVKTDTTVYRFYGVPLREGPNLLTAVALGANGLRGNPTTETIYGPGDPASIVVAALGNPVADGRTPITVRIFALDRWQHAAAAGSRVTVTVQSGDAYITDVVAKPRSDSDSQPPEPQVTASPNEGEGGGSRFEGSLGSGGNTYIHLAAGIVPGLVVLDVRVAEVASLAQFYLSPLLHRPFVNGIAQVGGGNVPGTLDGDGIFDNGGSRKTRIGLYGSGTVWSDALFTFAYESQNPLAPLSSLGPYTQDPNERPYLTYGDSSVLNAQLLSNDHVYARLDRGSSSLMWGRYDATIGNAEVGAYHQLLSGFKADVSVGNADRVRLSAFTAKNPLAFASLNLPALGLATLQQNLHADIVVGSDFLQLVALDRRSGAVISQTPMIRNVDYTIDYATGVLRFINIPLPYDPNFNPQVVSIQYQYQGPGVDSRSTGGELSVVLGHARRTHLSLGYVNDATGTQNFALTTQSLTHDWRNGSWAFARASSAGAAPNVLTTNHGPMSGNALWFNYNVHGQHAALQADFATTSSGYQDPFGGLSTPGLMTYHVAASHYVTKASKVEFGYSGTSDQGIGTPNSQSDATLSWMYDAGKKISFLLGLDQHQQRVGTLVPTPAPSGAPTSIFPAATNQTQAKLGITYRPSKRVTAMLQQFVTVAGSDVGSTQPTQTQLELDYVLGEKSRVYARMLRSTQPSATIGNANSGIAYGVPSTESFQVGFQESLSPTTTVSEDYSMSQIGGATNLYSATGVQQKFQFGKFISGDAFVQKADSVGGSIGGFAVYGTEVSYNNAQKLRSSLSYQSRTGVGGGSTLGLGIAGRISPVFSAVGTFERSYSASSIAIQDRLSIAHRPLNNDRLISLLDYTRTNATGLTSGVNDVVSYEELWRPTEQDEIAGRFAYKLSGDSFYAARTSMVALRVQHRFHGAFDIGAAVREFAVPAVPKARTTAIAAELGYALGDSARLAVGYNFEGSADPTLTGTPSRKGLYLTVTTLVDRIFGWGKQ